ncbi:uncharacterized protein LOC133283584 isoform X2 [Gastrolobium bilobum]|uniref:uncharacterized protein LOC133283584 isoform X2 n=1 Tax=Gastrolobium bilobum TaxID=150636 RepID=UPI002AB21968|nr:uncharacterized protein LOC133283584 isoform X2 [Gastrolobium bilobum]
MGFKTRARKLKRTRIVKPSKSSKRKKMERGSSSKRIVPRKIKIISLKEIETLQTFYAHLHLTKGVNWTEDIWGDMLDYYEDRSGCCASMASLKWAFEKYFAEYKLAMRLADFGIHFDPITNMLNGTDICWTAAEMVKKVS